MEQKTISFGFSRKKDNKPLIKSNISENEDDRKNETEFVTEVDETFSKKNKKKEKEYIIPLIKENKWRLNRESGDKVEDTAVKEIVEDAKRFQESESDKGKSDLGLSIPLLMQNKVPDGFETDDKLNVELRPEEPEEADYEQIPIEQFGIAMLRGMGWKDGQGIGKNNKAVAPVTAVLRPKGLGLGADRSQAAQLNEFKTASSGSKDDKESLTLKKGAYCVILKGANKDLYGVIEGFDEDNARVMVKLTVSGKIVTQSQYALRLVDKDEYKKYSKYLNKGKADKYKEDEEKKKEKERKREKHHKSRRDRDVSDEDQSSRSHDNGYRDDEYKHSGNREDDHRHSSSDSRKRKYDRLEDSSKKSSSSQNGHSRSESLWMKSQIRVRIVSKDYKKGKYYNSKVDVIDVLTPNNIVCRTDDGKVLEGLSQTDLETLVPKEENSYIVVVSGKYKGQLARILKRDKSKYVATLQLLKDRGEVVKIDFDSICEYTGNIDDEYDY